MRLRSSVSNAERRTVRRSTSACCSVDGSSRTGTSRGTFGSMAWNTFGSRMRSRRRRSEISRRVRDASVSSLSETVSGSFSRAPSPRRPSRIIVAARLLGMLPSPRSTFHVVNWRSGLPVQQGQPSVQGQLRIVSRTAGRISCSRS